MTKKYYTLEEATAILPEVKKAVSEIRSMDQSRLEKQKAYSELMLAVASNGGDFSEAYLLKLTKSLDRAERQLRRLIGNLQRRFSCEVKGLSPLLVDFYTVRDGREVYLCWKEGEDEIAHWHDLDAGFAGRRPI